MTFCSFVDWSQRSGGISSTPKMEEVVSSETSVAVYQSTRHQIPNDPNLAVTKLMSNFFACLTIFIFRRLYSVE
jgi:hypothetical protein